MEKQIVKSYLNQVEAMKSLATKEQIFSKSLDLILYLGENSKEVPINDFLKEIMRSYSNSFEYEVWARDAVVILKRRDYIKEINCTLPENKEKKCYALTKKGNALYRKSVRALEDALKS